MRVQRWWAALTIAFYHRAAFHATGSAPLPGPFEELGTMNLVTLKTGAQMADLAVRLIQAGAAHHVPLIRAAMAGALRFTIVPAGARMPLRLLDPSVDSRPLTVILAGDDVNPAGPKDFPQVRRLVRWASGIMVHATCGEPKHYAEAARATVLLRRFLLVETCSGREAEWCALAANLAPQTPTVRITVRPGAPPHPAFAMPAREVLQ